jgi:hypothetical protein
MKKSFLVVTLLALLVFSSRDLQAQAYDPYYNPYGDYQYQQYLEWQQYLAYLQQYDPYYELHVMHYQLYRPPYPSYQFYQPCCYATAVIIPERSASVGARSRPGIYGRQHGISPRSQAAVSPLPGAVSRLPSATGRR